eukprot:scaffold751_cov395-Prasinococcus_capsulatus_cf.AAC.8
MVSLLQPCARRCCGRAVAWARALGCRYYSQALGGLPTGHSGSTGLHLPVWYERACTRVKGAGPGLYGPARGWSAAASANAAAAQESVVEEEAPESQMKGVSLDGRPLYLDLQATTPVDPRVLDKMIPYLTEQYGNPHSRTHMYGWESEDAMENAREQVASLIGADPKEIIFTSGATESNNLAIKGVANFYKDNKRHVITTQTDHKCVLDSCRYLQQHGFDVTYLKVQPNGLIDMRELEESIRPDTAIVSVMAVNNEIGVVQPIAAIGDLCRSRRIFFHTDAAQVLRP